MKNNGRTEKHYVKNAVRTGHKGMQYRSREKVSGNSVTSALARKLSPAHLTHLLVIVTTACTYLCHSCSASPSTFMNLFLLLLRPPRWPSGKTSASRAEDPGFESRLNRDFSGSSHTSDLKIGTPMATLPGDWRYRVSAGTGRPGVSIL